MFPTYSSSFCNLENRIKKGRPIHHNGNSLFFLYFVLTSRKQVFLPAFEPFPKKCSSCFLIGLCIRYESVLPQRCVLHVADDACAISQKVMNKDTCINTLK